MALFYSQYMYLADTSGALSAQPAGDRNLRWERDQQADRLARSVPASTASAVVAACAMPFEYAAALLHCSIVIDVRSDDGANATPANNSSNSSAAGDGALLCSSRLCAEDDTSADARRVLPTRDRDASQERDRRRHHRAAIREFAMLRYCYSPCTSVFQ